MPAEHESIIFSTEVLDNATDDLDKLFAKLVELDAMVEVSFPIEMDADAKDVFATVEAAKREVESFDDETAVAHLATTHTPVSDIGGTGLDRRRTARAMRGKSMLEEDIRSDMMGSMLDMRRRAFGRGREVEVGDETRFVPRTDVDVSPGLARTANRIIPDLDLEEEVDGLREALSQFKELRLTMGGFMAALAAVIPLLAIFIGALPAAIAGLTALATAAIVAAGALVGITALGLGGLAFQGGKFSLSRIEEVVQQITDAFLEGFLPVMDALEPMMMEIFNQVEFAIRDLGERASVILFFTDEIVGAFEFLADTMGPFMTDAAAFFQSTLPAVNLLIGGLADLDIFAIFDEILVRTLPHMVMFTNHLLSILEALFEVSLGFMQIGNIIMFTLGVFSEFITAIPLAAEFLGILAGTLLLVVSATSLYTVATSSAIAKVIELTGVVLSKLLPTLFSMIAAEIGAAGATVVLTVSLAALLAVITFGIAPALTGLIGGFVGLGDSARYAADQVGRFDSMSSRFGGSDFAARGAPGDSAYPQFGDQTTIVAPDKETGNAVANTKRFQDGTTDSSDVDNRHHS